MPIPEQAISTTSTDRSKTCMIARSCRDSLGKLNDYAISTFSCLFRHDVGLQIVGQPARDLCRHFAQRFVSAIAVGIRQELTESLGGTTYFESRTTLESCLFYFHQPTSRLLISKSYESLVLAKRRSAVQLDLGLWEHLN